MITNELADLIAERIKHYRDAADSNTKENQIHSHYAYCIGAKDALFELYTKLIRLESFYDRSGSG